MQIILLSAGGQASLSLGETPRIISSSSSTNGSEFDYDLSGEDICQNHEEKPARKRQRLDHMTEQEKLFRRKLKNRVAAQTARDKKKARMDELEIIVEKLRIENNLLRAENERLLAENTRLAANSKVTGESRIADNEDSIPTFMEASMYPVESAALINGPLPQGKGYIQLPMILRMLLHLMLILQSPATRLKSNALKKSTVFDTFSQNPSKLHQMERRMDRHRTNPVIQFLKDPP